MPAPTSDRIVLLPPLGDELKEPPVLKFRLYYEGPLRATQRDPEPSQRNRLAKHKHEIRRCFHSQLKFLWRNHKYLSEYSRFRDTADNRPIYESGAFLAGGPDGEIKIPLVDYVAGNFQQNEYRFVPLVCEEFSLLVSLRILFMRRDTPGSALQAGDLDNRIKTLIDCLQKPKNANELVGNERPLEGEDPFFCLLEEDKLVSHFEVETDMLLEDTVSLQHDRSKVRLVVSVEIRPYLPTFFNLAFS